MLTKWTEIGLCPSRAIVRVCVMIGAVGPWGKGKCNTALVEPNSRLELGNSSLDVRFLCPSPPWPKRRCSLLSGNADGGVPAAVEVHGPLYDDGLVRDELGRKSLVRTNLGLIPRNDRVPRVPCYGVLADFRATSLEHISHGYIGCVSRAAGKRTSRAEQNRTTKRRGMSVKVREA